MSQKVLINETDWDLLLVLDACRYDFFEEVNDIPGDLVKAKSPANNTIDWAKEIWIGYRDDIIYVSGNPYISNVHYMQWQGSRHFFYVEDVWDWGWETIGEPNVDVGVQEPIETTPPWNVNKGVMSHVCLESGKIVAHYMQPHSPYIGETRLNVKPHVWLREEQKNPAERVKIPRDPSADELDPIREVLVRGYVDNIKCVLKYVKLLVDGVDRDIVITSDHGELLGEHGQYWHGFDRELAELYDVPWLEVES